MRWFLERAGSANEFSNNRAGLQRKRKTNNMRVSPGKQNKDEVFKPVDKSLMMNLIQPTRNVNLPMKCAFQFSLQDYKQQSVIFFNYY